MSIHLAGSWLDAYLLEKSAAAWDFQPVWAWDRYRVDGRLFAAACLPDAKYGGYGGKRLLTLKCDPGRAALLRAEFPAVLPGFYCDKRCWISVDLDGGVPDDVLRDLCDDSYRLVTAKLSQARRRALGIPIL